MPSSSLDLPIPQERLQTISVPYRTFEGGESQGNLLVLDVVVPQVQAIFKELLDLEFPISQMRPIDDFQGDDEASMKANNTSAFNGRKIAGSSQWSLHAYGLAIDINPLQNPFLNFVDQGMIEVSPAQGTQYINRMYQKPGMVEPIVSVFQKNGFTVWGGSWNTPIDYHHFQTTRELAEILASCSYKHGKALFELMIHTPSLLSDLTVYKDAFLKAYHQHGYEAIKGLGAYQNYSFLETL